MLVVQRKADFNEVLRISTMLPKSNLPFATGFQDSALPELADALTVEAPGKWNETRRVQRRPVTPCIRHQLGCPIFADSFTVS